MKTIVLFTAAWQSYSKGDVAGFDTATAEELIALKKVAEPYESAASTDETLTIQVDATEAAAKVEEMLAEAEAELEAKATARTDELDAREAKLSEREEAVVAAEAALKEREATTNAVEAGLRAEIKARGLEGVDLKTAGGAVPSEEAAAPDGKKATKPPKQGAK